MSDSDKKSFLSDPNIPFWVRAGAIGVLAIIAIYPFISSDKKSDSSSEQAEVSDSSSNAEEQSSTGNPDLPPGLPVNERGLALSSAEKSKEQPASLVSTPAPEPSDADNNYGIFSRLKIPGPAVNNFRSVNIGANKKGEVWLAVPQQILSLDANYTPFIQLDDGIFDQLFESDVQTLSAFFIAGDGRVVTGSHSGQLLLNERNDWKLLLPGADIQESSAVENGISAVAVHGESIFFARSGLNKFNLKTHTTSKFPGFADVRIADFVESDSGTLYMAAKNGIWRLTDKGWEQLLPLKDSDPTPLALGVFKDGRIAVGTDDGLLLLDKDGNFLSRNFAGTAVFSVATLASGEIFVGTNGKGIRYFDGTEWFEGAGVRRLPGNIVRKIFADSSDNLWFAFDGVGIFRVKKSTLVEWVTETKDTTRKVDKSQPRDYPNGCRAAEEELKDIKSSGALKVVTISGRANLFVGDKLACPSGTGYLAPNGQGVIVNGFGGVVFDANNTARNSVSNFALPEKLQKAAIKTTFIDSKRNLWLGTDDGVIVLLASSVETFETEEELKGQQVKAITEDDAGNIWVGTVPPYNREQKVYTKSPLHRYDGTSWKHYEAKGGLPGWTITALRYSAESGLLIGTESGGAKLAGEGFERLDFGSSEVNAKGISGISLPTNGRIWFNYLYAMKGMAFIEKNIGHVVPSTSTSTAQYFASSGENAEGDLWAVAPNGTVWVYPRNEVAIK